MPLKPLRSLATVGLALALAASPLMAEAHKKPDKHNDDTMRLAGPLANQTIEWGECDFSEYGEATAARLNAVPGAACGTITVPRNWKNPRDGHTITIEVSKTATSTGNPNRQGIALVNPGGPGGPGLVWGPAMALTAPALAEAYDFIGFDPRGVGKSTPLICDVEVNPDFSTNQQTKAFVDGCLKNPLTPYINTEQTVYDMDFIRGLLGERRTSFIGYSYGTWLGSWYGAKFPSKTHRLLLDSATDFSSRSLERTWDLQPHTRDRQFQQMLLPYMARNPEMFYMGTDPMKIREAWERTGGTRDLLGQMLTSIFIIPAMYDTSQYLAAGMTVRTYAYTEFVNNESLDQKLDVIVQKLLDEKSLTADNKAFIKSAQAKAKIQLRQSAGTQAVDGAFEAIRCQDGRWNSSQRYWDNWLKRLEKNATFIAPFMSTPACAWWPAQTSKPKTSPYNAPATMVVQSEMDAATAYEGAVSAARSSRNTWMISVDNEGSHGVYPYLTTCVDDPVEAFMLRGATPSKKFSVCGAKPLPLETGAFPVGGTIGRHGTLKVKTIPKEVRQANRFVKELLRAQSES